ncbi:MAG: hypothetical protein M3Y50_02865 [Acidobacteriota bacterium]|nr:hypothetical protein [Acidobacteriota bacterium]
MTLRTFATLFFAVSLATPVVAQEPGATLPEVNAAATAQAPGILPADQAAKILPSTVFFRGQSAPIQGRNSAGVRFPDQMLLLVALVDTSGYSSQVQSKYQAYFITESPLEIDGHRLAPGAYGCGFLGGDSFIVQDLGAHDLFTAKAVTDPGLHRPRPLQIVAASGAKDTYRLYAGRTYVTLQAAIPTT